MSGGAMIRPRFRVDEVGDSTITRILKRERELRLDESRPAQMRKEPFGLSGVRNYPPHTTSYNVAACYIHTSVLRGGPLRAFKAPFRDHSCTL